MEIWQKKEIRETFYTLEIDQNGRPLRNSSTDDAHFKKSVTVIKNPTVKQLWFYHIKNKNIFALEAMLANKDIKILINERDVDADETITHLALTENSVNLVDFCIKHNADFFVKSRFDEETAFYTLAYSFLGLNVFKKVCRHLGKEKIIENAWEENAPGNTWLFQLCKNENLKKILWLDKEFPNLLDKVKENSQQWNRLLDELKNNELHEEFYLITGLQKIKNDLEDNLKNKETTNKRVKI